MTEEPKAHRVSDIVEDLRGRARGYRIGGSSAAHTAVMLENAADEIDRLRAALREISTYEIDEGCPCNACQHSALARAALETPTPPEAHND